MCGRATLKTPVHELVDFFGLEPCDEDWPARYNIAPTQPIATVRVEGGKHKRLRLLRWGLIPWFAKEVSIGNRMINARVESLASRGVFREALAERRCLVLVDGFYEWSRDGKTKQPHYIHRRDGKPMALAGLWDRWRLPEGEVIDSCTIITRPSAPPVTALHDRMPLVVPHSSIDLWLDPAVHTASELKSVLDAEPDVDLITYPVDPSVNNPANDAPDNINEILLQPTLFG